MFLNCDKRKLTEVSQILYEKGLGFLFFGVLVGWMWVLCPEETRGWLLSTEPSVDT